MGILVDREIRAYCKRGLLITKGYRRDPYEFLLPDGKTVSGGVSCVGYDVAIDRELLIPAGGFEMCGTIESFRLPDFITGFVHDKSSWARRGLVVQNTVLEPGWRGHLTVEFTNHGPTAIRLQMGTPIAQVIFHVHEVVDKPYDGKYQDQEAGPQEAR